MYSALLCLINTPWLAKSKKKKKKKKKNLPNTCPKWTSCGTVECHLSADHEYISF